MTGYSEYWHTDPKLISEISPILMLVQVWITLVTGGKNIFLYSVLMFELFSSGTLVFVFDAELFVSQ